MTEIYDVSIKLIGNQKPCPSGHKVSDKWLLQEKTSADICWAAYNSTFMTAARSHSHPQNPEDLLLLLSPKPLHVLFESSG